MAESVPQFAMGGSVTSTTSARNLYPSILGTPEVFWRSLKIVLPKTLHSKLTFLEITPDSIQGPQEQPSPATSAFSLLWG
jgi:hypothetical protein